MWLSSCPLNLELGLLVLQAIAQVRLCQQDLRNPSIISHSPKVTPVDAISPSISQLYKQDKGIAIPISLSTKIKALAIAFIKQTDTELSVGQHSYPKYPYLCQSHTFMNYSRSDHCVTYIKLTLKQNKSLRIHFQAHLLPKSKQQIKGHVVFQPNHNHFSNKSLLHEEEEMSTQGRLASTQGHRRYEKAR